MQTITLTLVGKSPLLVHSDRGSNPLAEVTKAHKALTIKKKKTSADHEAIAESEYRIAFYTNTGFFLPTGNIKSTIVEGARLSKLGTAFNRCIMILADSAEIIHSGPKTQDGAWRDPSCVDCRSVKVGQSRIMRYRPKLHDWSVTAELIFDETIIDGQQIVDAATAAGNYVGLGDYRPAKGGMFGRYDVAVVA